jgi:hypothetical protein
MNPPMCDAAFGSCGILDPYLLDMDERAFAQAEQIGLKGGEGDE